MAKIKAKETDRSPTANAASAAGSAAETGSWAQFWFRPIDPAALDGVRIVAGVLLLAWLASFAGQYPAFFGLNGWFDARAFVESANLEDRPPIGWSPIFLVRSAAGLHAFYFGALLVFALFTLGVATRLTAVLTWLAVLSFTANPAIDYGADYLLKTITLYLMVGYGFLGLLARPRSLGGWLGGSRGWLAPPVGTTAGAPPSAAATVAIRLLQVHFAIIIFTSGVHKLQIGEWWAGDALWFPMHAPMQTSLEQVMAEGQRTNSALLLTLYSLGAYAVLAWELCFPFFIWQRRLRPWLLVAGITGWIGSWFVYDLPLYGPAILTGCLAFVEPATWRAVIERFSLGRPAPMPAGTALAAPANGGPKSQERELVPARGK